MTISGIIKKDGRSFVRVSFLRGRDYAEGISPDGIIDKSEGFTEEELVKLKEYITESENEIMEKAKGINPLRDWLGFNQKKV